jgi:hypothetical protein
MMNPLRKIGYLSLVGMLGTLMLGCQAGGPSRLPTEPERRAMLALMLPTHIKILPFTRVASFDKDDIPDGLLVVLRPTDRFGDAVKAAGLFYFELYSFQEASSERKGQRLAFWDQTINTPEAVASHWTHAEIYEFKLGWPEGATSIRPGHKYVLMATYRTPWDETIVDEYVMDFTLPPGTLQRAPEKKPPHSAPTK